jgi:hypothetical protein
MKPFLSLALRWSLLALDFALGAVLMGRAVYRLARRDCYWDGGRE